MPGGSGGKTQYALATRCLLPSVARGYPARLLSGHRGTLVAENNPLEGLDLRRPTPDALRKMNRGLATHKRPNKVETPRFSNFWK